MFDAYKEAFIRLFYPVSCEICHSTLELEERILCSSCAEALDAIAWPLEDALVDERFEHLDHVWTVYAYASPLRELLHGVKYSRKDYLLQAFQSRALELAGAITSDFWYDAILPIPIDRLKRVQRHFNQAEILADNLSPWLTPPVRRSFLIKKHPLPSQTSLSHEERAINVYGAFKLRHPHTFRFPQIGNGGDPGCRPFHKKQSLYSSERAHGKTFLLIDDVLTTGATANEASRLLKAHGARRVDFLALARTLTPDLKNNLRFLPYTDKIPTLRRP